MADVKFSELDVLSAADSGDIFAVVDTSASTSKKLSIDNLFGTVPVDVRVTDATDSSSTTTGSIRTAGGIGVVKALSVGTTSTLTGLVTVAAGLVPDASDGAYLGTSSLEFSDLFLADGAVISLGDGGADVTLTHVADTGVTLNSTNKIMFNDTSQFIQGVSATVLGLGATDEIDLTATAIDINGTVDISGLAVLSANTTIGAGAAGVDYTLTFNGADNDGVITWSEDEDYFTVGDDILMSAAEKVQFRDAAISISSSTDGQLDIDADTEIEITTTTVDLNGILDVSGASTLTGVVTVGAGIIADAQDGAYLGSASRQFSDLFLADAAVISLGDDGDVTITHDPDDGIILKNTNTTDVGGVSIYMQTGDTDIAAADKLGAIYMQAPDEGTGTDAITVAAGIEAVSEGDFSSSSNATKLSFLTGASEAAAEKMALSSAGILTVTSSVVPSASDGGALGSAALEWSDLFLADGSVISFQDDQAVTLTSSATGLTLNSTNKIMFNDATQFIQGVSGTVLGLGATDEIDLTATTVDLNGTLNVSGVATFQGNIVPSASGTVDIGSASAEINDIFFSTGSVLNFADGQEVTLTAATTGLTVNSTKKFMFGAATEFIHGSGSTTLALGAATAITATSPTITFAAAGADQVVKHGTDAYDLAFQQTDGDEVARIHDGGTAATIETTALDLTVGAAAKGGFGFKRPVYNVTATADDADCLLAMKHSGAMIMVTGSGYDMDIILPIIAAGDEGWHVTIAIKTAFSSGKDLEIATNGHGDATDRIYMYMNTAGTSGAEATANDDVVKFVTAAPAGTLCRMTCIQGGTNETWIAEIFQPSGTAATTTAAVA